MTSFCTYLHHSSPFEFFANRQNRQKHYPFYTNLTFPYKTQTLDSLYSHTLLIVVHEQKFIDLLSSTYQVGLERIVLDLKSEVIRGPGSIPTGGNILSLSNIVYLRKARLADL